MNGKLSFSHNPLLFILLLLAGCCTAFLLTTSHYYLAPIPPIAFIGGLLLKQYPILAYYYMLFGIPHNDIRTSMTKLLGVVLVGIVASQVIIERKKLSIKNAFFFPLGAFIIVNIISTLFTKYPQVALDDIRKLVIVIIFFFLALSLIPLKSFLETVPKLIIASLSLGSYWGIYGYLLSDERYVHINKGLVRACGSSGDPNVFSVYILYSIPLLIHYLIYSKKKWVILAACLTALHVTAIILTFSRGASLILCITVLLLFYEHKKLVQPINLGLVVTGIATAFALFVLLAPSSYWERNKSLSADDNSVSRRLDYIKVSIYALSEHPFNIVVGTGPGTFRDCWAAAVMRGDVAKGSGNSIRRYAHNTYLEVLVGTGLGGFTLFIASIVVTMKLFIRGQREMMQIGRQREAALIGAYRLSFITSLLYYPMISMPYNKFFWVSLAFSQLSVSCSSHYSSSQVTQCPS